MIRIAFYFFCLVLVVLVCQGCNSAEASDKKQQTDSIPEFRDSVFTPYSTDTNKYVGFNSVKAINAIANIENEYFNNYRKGVSKYYGTNWYETTFVEADTSTASLWFDYKHKMDSLDIKPDSFHCTIYAIKALQAGMGNDFEKFEQLHKQYYGKHEHAGWSVAYILTRFFNWKAYLIIDETSEEYQRCVRNYKTNKKYYVWRQPDIKLEKLFVTHRDEKEIEELLQQHEFGWGFSYQGIHTWITRYTQLKECRWEGAPGKDFDYCDGCSPLFITHYFFDYYDYFSHVVVFPPKK